MLIKFLSAPHFIVGLPSNLYPLKHCILPSSPKKYSLSLSITKPFSISGNIKHWTPKKYKHALHIKEKYRMIC